MEGYSRRPQVAPLAEADCQAWSPPHPEACDDVVDVSYVDVLVMQDLRDDLHQWQSQVALGWHVEGQDNAS